MLALCALIGWLWSVGLTEAAELTSVFGGIAGIAALAAPYVFPPGGKPAGPVVAAVPAAGPSPAAAAANPGAAGFAGTPAPASGVPDPSAKTSVRNALMEFDDIQDPEFRRQVLRLMGERLGLGYPFSVPYRAMARDHVIEVVDRVWDFRDPAAARSALAGALETLRPDDAATMRLKALI